MDGSICLPSSGAVAQDGRVEPGDMILEVNGISFENMSNDDAVKTLREAVQKPGSVYSMCTCICMLVCLSCFSSLCFLKYWCQVLFLESVSHHYTKVFKQIFLPHLSVLCYFIALEEKLWIGFLFKTKSSCEPASYNGFESVFVCVCVCV